MNSRHVLMVTAIIMISCFELRAEKDIFDQTMPMEIRDEKIAQIENAIKTLSQQLKQANENNNLELINHLEMRLKQLFKERAYYIKKLEKKGFAPIVNRTLDTDIVFRIKQQK